MRNPGANYLSTAYKKVLKISLHFNSCISESFPCLLVLYITLLS